MNSSNTTSINSVWFPVLGIAGLSLAAGAVVRKVLAAKPREPIPLRDKVVLITGGSRGLGLALAQEFGKYGSRIAICARDANELDEASRQLQQNGVTATPFVHDVANPEEATRLIQEVIERLGAIDVLINNAGIIKVAPFESFDHAEYERAMNVMFWAPVNLSLAALPHMESRGAGQIVNVTSVGGRVSIPHLLPYSCAKFALVGFSTGLSAEAKSKGIHVLTVVPGLMRTGSYLNAEFAGDASKEFAWFGILGNLPGFSVAADYAASEIRQALQAQKYNCTISLPAKILVALEALAPDTLRTILWAVKEILPDEQNAAAQRGKYLNAAFGKLFQAVTSLGRTAAANLNEG
ncbi:MAG TPA: SDR family oxidoreductase [Bryobacteraceae bacterium]|jgi:short-subunit dehydrogenase|nr:SDR family oxidoreductase [Bryobacteraceae bacterium]